MACECPENNFEEKLISNSVWLHFIMINIQKENIRQFRRPGISGSVISALYWLFSSYTDGKFGEGID